jgi:hypothetical protein
MYMYLKELKVIVKSRCMDYFNQFTYILILQDFEKKDGLLKLTMRWNLW